MPDSTQRSNTFFIVFVFFNMSSNPLGVLLHVPEINDEVERELSSINKDCYQAVVPCLVASVSSRVEFSAVFFNRVWSVPVEWRRNQLSSAGTKWCLRIRIVENGLVPNRRSPPGEFIILRALQTRKISPRTQSLVYEIKEASWGLERHGYGIPSHVGVMGNERSERLAGEVVQGDTEFAAPVRPSDFRPLSRVRMLDSWQCSWSEGRMGGYT
jgi:hypothetical protein